jgi:tRNA dimethylallyltransferase
MSSSPDGTAGAHADSRDAPDRQPSVVTVVGPTGVGKTSVGIRVARALGGEIVSADSRQIYRGMDVGTAKPTSEELAACRHHLIDIVEPSESYDAARYAADAEAVIVALKGTGTEPVVVGGTGFYIESLFRGLFDGPGRDDEVRRKLSVRLDTEGATALHAELRELDPETAGRLHPNDGARIVRALEVYVSTGTPLSVWHESARRPPSFPARYFGLTMRREDLYARIDARVDAMMRNGLLHEVRTLVESGRLTSGMPAASAVGYRELLALLAGRGDDLEGAVEDIKRNTRRYAKRQLTWFSSIENLTWLNLSEMSREEAAGRIVATRRA